MLAQAGAGSIAGREAAMANGMILMGVSAVMVGIAGYLIYDFLDDSEIKAAETYVKQERLTMPATVKGVGYEYTGNCHGLSHYNMNYQVRARGGEK